MFACFSSRLQCHRIHRTLASQFKYALVWVSKVTTVTFRGMTLSFNPINNVNVMDWMHKCLYASSHGFAKTSETAFFL